LSLWRKISSAALLLMLSVGLAPLDAALASPPSISSVQTLSGLKSVQFVWRHAAVTKPANFKTVIELTSGRLKITKTFSSATTTALMQNLDPKKTYKAVIYNVSGVTKTKAFSKNVKANASLLANQISFAQPQDMFLNSEPQRLSVTSPLSNATVSSQTPQTCSVSGYRVTAIRMGDCLLRASAGGDFRYSKATNVDRLMTVGEPLKPQVRTLLWSDEFNRSAGQSFDSSKWTADIGDGCLAPHNNCGWGNSEKQYYAAENVRQSATDLGSLEVFATRVKQANSLGCYYGSCEWLSGKITTYGKVAFTYGYLEARIKAPKGAGTWPAFWLLGTNIREIPWPKSGEIDVMEYKGSNPQISYGTVHFADPSNQHRYLGGTKDMLVDLSADYHRYAVMWKPDEMTFYVDDVAIFQVHISQSGLNNWPFGKTATNADPKFYLILNLAMGGHFGGAVDSRLESAAMNVDWVRYYSVDGFGKVSTK
jgi:beta-glucanase (GH16 family)